MRGKIFASVCIFALVLTAGACKKKEETPPILPQMTPGQQQEVPPGHQSMMPPGETSVLVPEAVEGKWKAVVITVEDKTTKKKNNYTIDLHSDFPVPNSKLKISVGDFMPDFKMDGRTITSLSNETNNPAVSVKIYEDGKEVFKGWLYSRFPSIHAFEHPQYSVLLKNAVKKG